MKAALYLRVSTDQQTIENQRAELERVCAARGWSLVRVYADEGISGAKSRDKRPGFNDLCNAAVRREFDVVLAWSVDRISRSLQDLIVFMGEMRALDVQLYLHQQALDTTTPAGKLMYQLTGAFAEYEREIIRARIKLGVARAKRQGKTWGNKSILTPEMIAQAHALQAEGKSATETAAELNVSVRTVFRLRKAKLVTPSWE